MSGFFDSLLNLGAAHVQHVNAVRTALSEPSEERAVAYLSSYLQGLTDASLQGFRVSLAVLAGNENDAGAKQSLQWILENIDALRSGRFEVAADPPPPPEEPEVLEPTPPHESARVAREPVGTIAGTWSGKMANDDGESFDATFRFSVRGCLLYGYGDRSGAREVELTRPGQRIQFVPPGGGVVTIDFDEVAGSPHAAGYVARFSEERASYGVLDQTSNRIEFRCELHGNQLAVLYTSVGTKHTSGSGIMVGGGRAYRARGMLSRTAD